MKKQIFFFVFLLIAIVKLHGQDITSDAAIVLPVTGQTSYSVASGSTVNIRSGVSITLNPGVTLHSGSIVKMSIFHPPPASPSADLDKNWVYTRSYDESGREVGASKAFFDNNGQLLQTQTKSENTGQVLASQTLYDLQGRAAANTLVAPTNNSAFAYKDNFVTNTAGTKYDYTNFDWNNTFNSSRPYAKTDSPDPVGNTVQGTLGWYYSNNNTLEPMVAATGYPYSRTDYFHDGTGAAKRSAGIGESLKMGLGREVSGNSFPIQGELNHYITIRNLFFPSATVGASPPTMIGQALQTISTDQNGASVLSITDLSGKMNLMTARADAAGEFVSVNTLRLSNVMPAYVYTFIEQSSLGFPGNTLSITAADNVNINITCTSCSPQASVYSGFANGYVYTGNPGSTYVVSSADAFYATETSTKPDHTINVDQAPAQVAEPTGTSVQYFKLAIPSAVTTTGNFSLYNMTTETDITGTFTNGNTLAPGYYKIAAVAPTTPTAINNVTASYTVKYTDISYNYYNQLGQLIASIAPNGVRQLITGGSSGYTTASQLPFITTYEYDLQGRLIANTSPDAGRSEFVYRQDGKIRFSQSAYQRVAANAGTGNQEKFSYTNYDNIGRPVESGEYTVPTTATITFASTKTNPALQESVAADGGLTEGMKLSKVNTVYDLPVANPSTLVQDAGFLKGAVSYTTNANSSTWYNYDDHGRVTWMVKQIAGLTGYKTVNYTYNDQGNVTKVDYQAGVAGERFVHYYDYDEDGRLINVKTNTNGSNIKLQHAHYSYYLHGPLKRVELGDNLQGIDYTYTPQGWLKAINSPTGVATSDPGHDGASGSSFAKDAFGMQLEYFNGDYSRTGSNITSVPTGTQTYFNGNVTGMGWQSNKPAATVAALGAAIQDPTMYSYSYDPKYQYTQSVWGAPNYSTGAFAPNNSSIFQEKQITYDANGNINKLQRTGPSGSSLTDDFNYSYTTNTNQLNTVGNGSTTYGTYTYDETGRLKTQTKGSAQSNFKYDVTGKVTGIYDASTGTVIESYDYDEAGNRIKVTNSTTTTYYVYDASGNVLAIYNGTSGGLQEVPVYGSDRLGTYFASGSNYVYEMRDNVGSVRVAINRTKVGSQADVIQYNDYYPYGSTARTAGTGYRYEYQGAYAEKDNVTGFNNFDLRLYDSRIGRWLSVDPKGQYASPYEGMGNYPVGGSDPTGGDFWHTDSNGNLIADEGDNALSLSIYLHIEYSAAAMLFGTNSSWDEGTASNGIAASENIAGNYMAPNTVIHTAYGDRTIADQLSLIKYLSEPQATISEYKFNAIAGLFHDWKTNDGALGRFAYSIVDGPQVYFTHLLGINGNNAPYGLHADGFPAQRKELTEAGVGVVMSAMPAVGKLGATAAGIGGLKTFVPVLKAFERTGGNLEKANDIVKAYMGTE